MYSSYNQGGSSSSEIQGDGLQTLYLMNPNFNGFSDTTSTQQQTGNMMILNYAAGNGGINLETLPNGHHQQSQHDQHLVGVPLGSSGNLHDHLKLHEIRRGGGGGGHVPHLYQSLWSSLDQTGGGNQENGNNIPSGVVVASSNSGGGGTVAEVSVAQLGYHMPVVSPTRQGLSLSLSSQQTGYRSLPMDHNINHARTGGGGNFHVSGGGAASSSVSVITHGIPGAHNFVLGSKYLKGAQELLDEVVNIVGKEIKDEVIEKGENKSKMNKDTMVFKGEASSTNIGQTCELTSPQKQEIQMKKAKLITMLDEVEQRYSQYHHQMQIVVSSFEQATGVGSAKSYTQLALQTISKQFRSLKDAISSQIKAASKSLGEDEILEGKVQGSSRLKFVDQQIRQQKALQHFGMMQNNNVWRPQRGLPERAVSVLRAWLFEHFLHPYPKDSDKIMLAKQAGLTRSQVSNWFINARVRLWKPMVEEMYKEEMKNNQEAVDQSESNKNSSSKPTSPPSDQINMIINNTDDQDNYNTFNSKQLLQGGQKIRKSQLLEEAITTTHDHLSESRFVGGCGELNLPEGMIINSPKKLRPNNNMQMNSPNSNSILATQVMVHENGFGGFGELGSLDDEEELTTPNTTTSRFHGNVGGFSLTLGLPSSQSMQQNFLSDQIQMHGSNHHHHINIGNYNEVIHFDSS